MHQGGDRGTHPTGFRTAADPEVQFDSTQVRLNNLGQPVAVPPGHGAQSPVFNRMSAHYVEFAPTATTLLGDGDVVYMAPETSWAVTRRSTMTQPGGGRR